jgi:hypothetical protein
MALVDHLTRVTVTADSARAGALAAALGELGFRVRRERDHIVADSPDVGGREVKDLLRARGFEDREYSIFLEYVRRWGML